MAELYGASKQFIGMTATLINGYSSGIFHLLYRLVSVLTTSNKKKYQYLKKVITLPNGTRKYIYGKTQQELDEKVLVNMKSIFNAAQENGLVAKSPVSAMLKPGGKRTPEKEILTPQESQVLLDRVANPRARTFLLIALHTGMRRGETVGLQWDDIDFAAKMIHIQHNAVMSTTATTINDFLKTKSGHRDVPLSEELEEWLTAQKKNSHSKYVLAMQNHKPLTKSSYKSMWKLIERELPDTHVTAHILRHTYITRLFEAGLDIKEIQYLAGHSTVDMTLKVYTHYDRRSREVQTAERVREALRKPWL